MVFGNWRHFARAIGGSGKYTEWFCGHAWNRCRPARPMALGGDWVRERRGSGLGFGSESLLFLPSLCVYPRQKCRGHYRGHSRFPSIPFNTVEGPKRAYISIARNGRLGNTKLFSQGSSRQSSGHQLSLALRKARTIALTSGRICRRAQEF